MTRDVRLGPLTVRSFDARHGLTTLARRVRGEYIEMPGLRLTTGQASRLFSVSPDAAVSVLDELHRAAVLTRSIDGMYALNQ